MPSQKQACEGFTLVEVLVVVVIIAALAAMILPRLIGQTENAKLAEAYHLVGILKKAQLDRMDSTNEDPVGFTCVNPPATCANDNSDATVLAALRQLGLKDFPQRDFRYECYQDATPRGYCQAYRWVKPAITTSNPYIRQHFFHATVPLAVNTWYCNQGYVRADTGAAGGYCQRGCRVDPSHANWG